MAEEAKKKADAPSGPPAEKPSDKKEAGKDGGHGAHGGGGGGGGLLTKTPVLLGGVMLIEAVVLFAGFKFLGGGPKPSQGAELTATEEAAPAAAAEHGGAEGSKPASGEHGATPASEHGESAAASAKPLDKKRSIEIEVLKKVQFPNKVSGRIFFFDVEIYAMTKAENKEKVEGLIAERKNLITDRIRTIIAQIDPEKLGGGSLEPGLETLRRQVKYQLDEIVGDGMIDEVLVPRCIPFRADY